MGIFEDLFDKAKSFFAESSSEAARVQKRCYYELLEVSRDATEDDIKRAYKKLALKWHPDKNQDRKDECTAYFVLLQQAYEVLTDPQERAFYDKHRENIIRGSSAEERRDTGINLYAFFQKCYFGYGDDEDGFFNVYRKLFDTLASEEFPYIEDEEDKDFPSFGNSTSDYEPTVAAFYDRWSSFSTQRSFAWLDKYDLRDADDRYTLKCMEKENKKLRDAGKKERNEEIRNLVQYVRKRDPRVKLYREQLEERKRKEFERVDQERKQQIMKNLRVFEEQDNEGCALDNNEYLDQLDQIEAELDEQFGAFAIDEDGEPDPDSYYCIACEKKFKTSKLYTKHQKSNKHKQAVEELKALMAEDDKCLFNENEQNESNEEPTAEKKPSRNLKARKSKIVNVNEEESSESQDDAAESILSKTTKTKCRRKKADEKKQVPELNGANNMPIESVCMICSEKFPSRSKLFDHIKTTGHAALKETISKKGRKR